MHGPEYRRRRLLGAAQLLRIAKLSSVRDLSVSYWTEGRDHVVEVLNLEQTRSAKAKFTSALDVPTYPEFVEAVMLRCRV